jgi:hypothetical protein
LLLLVPTPLLPCSPCSTTCGQLQTAGWRSRDKSSLQPKKQQTWASALQWQAMQLLPLLLPPALMVQPWGPLCSQVAQAVRSWLPGWLLLGGQ